MQLELTCLVCLARLAEASGALATSDPARRERIMRRALNELAEADLQQAPPLMGARINRLVREVAGNADPYRAIKRRFNDRALALLPELQRRVRNAPDPLAAAVRVAIAGNVIDFAAGQGEGAIDLRAAVTECLEGPMDLGALEALRQLAATARSVLYLLDNAGEIVFDRPLIELLGPQRVCAVVRGAPTLNDATRADARQAGLEGWVELLDSGSDVPGMDWERCPQALRQRFQRAELVIAKGQGNYETLEGKIHPGLFHLLRVKCLPVSRTLGLPMGSVALCRGGR